MWPARRIRAIRPLPRRRAERQGAVEGGTAPAGPVPELPITTKTVGFAIGPSADVGRAEAALWLRQGDRDLESARESCQAGDYVWACFQAQKSAEMALKSLLLARGRHPKVRTHSVFELVSEVAAFDASFAALMIDANRLDGVSVTTRRPESIAGNLMPSEYFGKENAEACIRSAAGICDAARRTLTG